MRTSVLILGALLLSGPVVNAANSIAQVLPCGKPGDVGGLGNGVDLVRSTLDTTRFPDAVCNDGTPGVFYYGPATRNEDRDKWIIFLQGGGSCNSGQTCAERWCGINSPYGLDKMSSSLSKEQIRGAGFLAPDPRNEFRSWNRVLIYYCSSDQWGGTKANTLTAASANGGATVEYAIQFRGSSIVDAVLDTLRYATAPSSRRRVVRHSTDFDGDTAAVSAAATWPDLDAATHVIFAGSSGGGNGVRNNADRVGARLRSTNPGLIDYRAIVDAAVTGDNSQVDYSDATFCQEDGAGCTYESYTRSRWEIVDVALVGNRGDASCAQFHAALGSEWRCGDKDHVLFHHITTPWFVHQDLLDPVVGGGFVDANLGTLSDYANGVETTLRNLPVPEEPRGATPGLFVPQCASHEAFNTNSDVFDVRIEGLTYNDTVWNWWRGTQPQQEILAYNGVPLALAGCPPE